MRSLFGSSGSLTGRRAATTADSAAANGAGPSQHAAPGATQLAAAHPEIYVAAAFAAGVALAILVRRLGH